MDSDDSRPSTQSNDSDSRSSSPSEEVEKVLSDVKPSVVTHSGGGHSQLSTSSSSSDSSSSVSSSDSEDDTEKRTINDSSSSGNNSSSSDDFEADEKQQQEQQGSSMSAAAMAAEVDLKINHEDLSDVSDMESEKRVFSNTSPNDDLEDHDGNDDNDNDDDNEDDNDDVDGDDDEAETFSIDYLPKHTPQEGQPKVTTTKRNSKENDRNVGIKIKADDKLDDLLANKNEQKDYVEKESSNGGVRCSVEETLDDLVKAHDDDALDFEAEDGECQEISKDDGERPENNDEKLTIKTHGPKVAKCGESKEEGEDADADYDDDRESDEDTDVNGDKKNFKKFDDNATNEDLEEGEVSDEDEKRPEETEPKPVCRFYTRGQCTWGMSCRFLHPGVTDKGNYTMFENMVRSLPMPQASGAPRSATGNYGNHNIDYHDYRTERPPVHHRGSVHHSTAIYSGHHETRGLLPEVPVVVENAWERGLRTAKEMMRKANKRKEQDMDFEEKKMNLTLSPDELEKDPYFMKDRASSPSNYSAYSPPDRYGRGAPPYIPQYEDVDAYGRMTRYRELPPHRMPQYEDERRLRPTREVIVQRVESGRGDEWSDPWMRSKSPGARSGSYHRDDRRRRDRRSYSSNSSYSSSNSSKSDSSSDSSRSSSPTNHKRRYVGTHKVPSVSAQRRGGAGSSRVGRSPSFMARRSRRSPRSISPSYKRVTLEKKSANSPENKRKRMSTPPKKIEKSRRRRSSSSSDSDSSGSSYSDTDSGSSSSDSSSGSKDRTPQKRSRITDKMLNERSATTKKPEQPAKKRSPISIEIKKPATVGISALVSPTHSANSDKDSNKKSRREELLKQLRAVEDAIAKKRSKLA